MKKIIITLAFCAIVAMPIAAHADVMMGDAYVTQVEPMQQIEQLKTQLIALITQLIQTLQAQLDALQAQQTTAPTAPTAINQTMPEQTTPQLDVTVTGTITGDTMAVTVNDLQATCRLVVKDPNGNVLRDQNTWFKDQQGNGRQVIDVGSGAGRKFTYQVTCTKEGFLPFTKSDEIITQ